MAYRRFGETAIDATYRFEDEQDKQIRVESMDGTRAWGPPPAPDAPRSSYFLYRTDLPPRDTCPWLRDTWASDPAGTLRDFFASQDGDQDAHVQD